MKFSGFNFSRAGFCLLALLALALCGCKTYSGPPGKNLAVVTITNRPLAEVQSAVTNIFMAHGFTGGLTGGNTLTFTRKGSTLDKMVYGSVVFTDTVSVKAVVTTSALPDGSIGVSCKAWLDAAEDDPVFDGDHQVTPLRKGPYESLLQKVKRKLRE